MPYWSKSSREKRAELRQSLRFHCKGKGGGSSKTTTVQKQDPWPAQQPYLKDVFQQAQNIYRAPGPDYFPGQTTVPFSQQSEQALSAIFDRGMTGSPLNFAAGQNLADTISGNYLNSNPHLDATFNQAARQIQPQVASLFEKSGRYGSGAHQDVLQRGMNDLATDIYGGNYANERKNQLGAAALAPQFAAQDYADLQAALGVGGALEGKAREYMQGDIDRFNYYQNLPQQKLFDYSQLVGGAQYGGQTTATSPNYSNPLAGALGGGLGAYALGSSVPALSGLAGPWGIAGGAILGGLLS